MQSSTHSCYRQTNETAESDNQEAVLSLSLVSAMPPSPPHSMPPQETAVVVARELLPETRPQAWPAQAKKPPQAKSSAPVLYSKSGPFTSWSYGNPILRRDGIGGKTVQVFASPGENIAPKFQLVGDGEPLPTAVYGLVYTSNERANLELSVTHPALLNFLRAVDSHIRLVAEEKCFQWFQKSLTHSEIMSLHRPLLLPATDKEEPAELLRLKVPVGSFNKLKVWKVRTGEDGGWLYSAGSLTDILPGSRCWANVAVSSLYFLPRLFGCTLSVSDVMVFPREIEEFPFYTSMSVKEEPECDVSSEKNLVP
jgi:hypothetical protein